MLTGYVRRPFDDKNRITIPSGWRDQFADGGFLSLQGDVVVVYPRHEFETFVGRVAEAVRAGEKSRRLLWQVGRSSSEFRIDSAGRLLVPAELRDRFDKEVELSGVFTHALLHRPGQVPVPEEGEFDLDEELDHY